MGRLDVILYIKDNLSKGHSVAAIKKHLLIHGHKESEINKCIDFVAKDYEKGLVN